MALISPADQQRLRDLFAGMTRKVRLLFFTQTLDCETCPMTRQILDELPPLSEKITVEEINLVLDGARAKSYNIDRAPAIVIGYEDEGVIKDSRIRFLGAPSGYAFLTLVQAVSLAGGRQSNLSEESRKRIALVDKPVTMQVFTTPT